MHHAGEHVLSLFVAVGACASKTGLLYPNNFAAPRHSVANRGQ